MFYTRNAQAINMTERKRIFFIINPISGTLDKDFVIKLLDEILDKDKIDWKVVYTQYAGHAVEIAADAVKEGVDVVVAVGGDGTVNEVGRSLVNSNTALGILPFGSGNGLARHLGLPIDTKKTIEIIADGMVDKIDYGLINDIPFFCTCGVGFDAFVSLKFSEADKRGMLTYIEKALQEVLNYRPETYQIETEDGEVCYKAFLIACGNAAQYGNNAYIAPKAIITDGLLDVTILAPFTLLDVPSLAFQLFNKTIHKNSHIKTLKCKSLIIKREKEGVIHFDGDPMKQVADLRIDTVQQGLNVIVPREKIKDTSMLAKATDYFNVLKMMNEAIIEDIVRRNKDMVKKLTKKE